MKDFVNEISILKTLKASQAKNINNIHDAFSFYSQLWIVSDYCPGGSVHTLMKATKDPGLEECYVIAIARELAVALKHVHEVGIIHRDVKAANVLITQEGQLQLCDFGVSGVLESGAAKRHTVIGTPFWMPPEMFEEDGAAEGYGTEIDCWAFGCTLIELATGLPPNAKIAPHMLHKFLSKAPRLEGEEYSEALKAFVTFCLPDERKNRPTAKAIMEHPFVADTSKKYPTSILRELIERFAVWEQSGGERASLFNPNIGAAGPEALEDLADDGDDWNFSTTDDFDEEVYNQLADVVEKEHHEMANRRKDLTASKPQPSTPFDIGLTQRAQRGEQKMGRIFDPHGKDYEYKAQSSESDLPLRNTVEETSKVRESVIDLDLAMGAPEPQIDNVPTLKANRVSTTPFYGPDDGEDGDDDEDYPPYEDNNAEDHSSKRDTMAWSFPTINTSAAAENRKTMEWSFASAQMMNDDGPSKVADDTLLSAPTGAKLAPGFRPTLKHTATAPPGEVTLANPRAMPDNLNLDVPLADTEPTIDLDLATQGVTYDDDYYSRPSTGYSTHADSSFSMDDPFAFEKNAQTIRKSDHPVPAPAPNRASLHTHSQSEPNRTSNPEFDEDYNYALNHGVNGHARGSSYNDMETNLSRAPSVKASMDSLRHATDDDDDDSPEVTTRRAPYPQVSQASWDLYDTDTSSTSGPPPNIPLPKRPYDSNTAKRSNFAALRSNAGSDSERPRGRLHPQDQQPTRAGRGGGSKGQSADRQRFLPFPEPVGPSAAALADDADPEVVIAEVRRLLRDFNNGLQLCGTVLGSVGPRHGNGGNGRP